MKIPKTLKIGGHRVEILQKTELQSTYIGLAHYATNKIELRTEFDDEQIPESRITETFLHEVLHFISDNSGLGLKENQINGLACQLLQVIRENKLDFANGS